jgi:uncharacterized protein (DUF169 family)
VTTGRYRPVRDFLHVGTTTPPVPHSLETDMDNWTALSGSLVQILGLENPPIALTFLDGEVPDAAVPAFDGPMSAPTEDGRTGRVPASCVFWMKSTTSTFSTVSEDHGNCSVGRWVHGFATLDDIAAASDVEMLFSSGWVTSEDVARVEVVPQRPHGIVYGPLSDSTRTPDVVVLRLNPRQMMELADALPGLELSGKPQCQIVARAKAGQAAVSMGCALSRERTGMAEGELTCAIPAVDLPGIVERLGVVVATDTTVRGYAIADRTRFDTP